MTLFEPSFLLIPPEGVANLHTHTYYSDGKLAPAELVERAAQQGLRALAVTDHDCIDALPEAAEAAETHGMELIPGVELSVHAGNEEVHLLGYFFDPSHADLRTYLAQYRTVRRDRAKAIVERLHGLGIPLPFDDVLAQSGTGVLGRPHIARALAAAGYVETYGEAFERYLSDQGEAMVGKPRFPAVQALAMLHDAGGIGVLAHPGNWTTSVAIRYLVQAGLDGIEVIHPAHDDVLFQYYTDLAARHDLVESGGSDYHGFAGHEDTNLGRYLLDAARLERLRTRARQHQRIRA